MATSTAAIDQSALEAIRSLQTPGGDDLVSKIVHTFIEESARLVQCIAEAVENADDEGVRANAHSLKSCSGNVGAHRLAHLARDMETVAREGTLDNAETALCNLRTELSRAVWELERMFDAA